MKKNNLLGKLDASRGLMKFAESKARKMLKDADVKISFRVEEYDEIASKALSKFITDDEFEAVEHIMESETPIVYCFIDLDNYANNSNDSLGDAISLVWMYQNTIDMLDVNDFLRVLLKKHITKYKWVANCSDGSFEDESEKLFDTKKECYYDMREKALKKMTWNTDWYDVGEDDYIGYKVRFSRDCITHESYSGLYTYKIIEV